MNMNGTLFDKCDNLPDTHEELPQLPAESYFDAVILANGDYPSDSLSRKMLEHAPYVICCDGAFRAYMANGHRPDAIIGDGDSITPEERKSTQGLFHHVEEQDDNDLTKAVRFALSEGRRHLLLLGATGKREDHTLGNIALLNYYFHKHIDATMLTDHGLFRMYEGHRTFESFPGQQVSVFNFGCRQMRSEGLKYPLYPLEELWQGTLNEAVGDRFSIHADGCYLLFFVKGHKTIHN